MSKWDEAWIPPLRNFEIYAKIKMYMQDSMQYEIVHTGFKRPLTVFRPLSRTKNEIQ